MTIYKAGTMLTLTNELGVLRGELVNRWDSTAQNYLTITTQASALPCYAPDWTITPDRTLPTTPGSVVRGDAYGQTGALLALTPDNDDEPWYLLGGGDYCPADQITNWTLLFDAAEVSE